jgi:high-affinity iron transporter
VTPSNQSNELPDDSEGAAAAVPPEKETAATPTTAVTTDDPPTPPPELPSRSGRRRVLLGACALVVLAAGGAATVLAWPHQHTANQVTITASACAPDWAKAGDSYRFSAANQSFTVVNNSSHAGEIYLLDADGAVVGELEGLGPGTRHALAVTLSTGSYRWRCVLADQPVRTSNLAKASVAGAPAAADNRFKPATAQDLDGPVTRYRAYVTPKLGELTAIVATLRANVAAGDLTTARSTWLAAQLLWEQVGAAYGSFGDDGGAIDALASGLPDGVADKDFTGLHRIEYGLWHGESPASLLPIVDQLTDDLNTLRGNLEKDTLDPNDLSLRCHEILEDALRDHLTGMTDYGSGAGFAETYADLRGTQVVLGELADLVKARRPELLPTADDQIKVATAALMATQRNDAWVPVETAPPAQREAVNAAVGNLLETLADIPDLLEVRTN